MNEARYIGPVRTRGACCARVLRLAAILAIATGACAVDSGGDDAGMSDAALAASSTLVVRARGMLAGGVGPRMEVYVDGERIAVQDVRATDFQEYSFDSPKLRLGAKVDLFFSNDAFIAGQDRNLIVKGLSFGGVAQAAMAEASYDVGDTYRLATDGAQVLRQKEGMAWNGAMRFTLRGAGTGSGGSSSGGSTGAIPDVPLQPAVSSAQADYQVYGSGAFSVINNTWAAKSFAGRHDWLQQVGVLPAAADGAVSFRVKWSYPSLPGLEVLAYPEIQYGRSTSTYPRPGARLPMSVGAINRLETSYSGVRASGISGQGHLSYDLWTSTTPADLVTNARAGIFHRRAEIMMPTYPFGGYGVPASGTAAQGRGCGTTETCSGRGGSYVERRAFGGAEYDVFYTPATTDPNRFPNWQFIVFEPVKFSKTAGHRVDWKPIFDYMRTKGWVTNADYLNSIEMGVEPVATGGATTGDVTVAGFGVVAN